MYFRAPTHPPLFHLKCTILLENCRTARPVAKPLIQHNIKLTSIILHTVICIFAHLHIQVTGNIFQGKNRTSLSQLTPNTPSARFHAAALSSSAFE